MLTEKEYRLNTVCFELLSYFCIIPFEISGILVTHPTKQRLVFWFVLLTAQIVHFAMALWFMVNKVVSVGKDAIPTMPLDYCTIFVAILGVNSAIPNFIRWPEVAHCAWKSVQECDIDRCERKGGLWGYTYLEIYTMLAPLGIYPGAVVFVMTYCMFYIWPFTDGLNLVARLVAIFAETLIVMSAASWIHFGLLIHITFMEKVGLTVKTQLKKLEHHHDTDQTPGIQESVQKLRALQVEMNAFNASQKNVIIGFKMVTMGCVIFCYFAAIQFFHVNLLMGVCNMLLATEAAFFFGFSYNKGFSIPRSIQSLRSSLRLHVALNREISKSDRMVLKRQIKSVGKMAVRVGNFHYFQRVSTPNFVDSSVKNMVRLVMFYRRHIA